MRTQGRRILNGPNGSLYRQQLKDTGCSEFCDLAAPEQCDATSRSVQLELGSSVGNRATQNLPGGLKVGFGATVVANWSEHSLESSTGALVTNTNTRAFPNPLRLSSEAQRSLPVQELTNTTAQTYFLNAAMALEYSANYIVNGSVDGRYIVIPDRTYSLGLPPESILSWPASISRNTVGRWR